MIIYGHGSKKWGIWEAPSREMNMSCEKSELSKKKKKKKEKKKEKKNCDLNHYLNIFYTFYFHCENINCCLHKYLPSKSSSWSSPVIKFPLLNM